MSSTETVEAWARSEDRHDPYFADLARLRLSGDAPVDETQLSLALRYPFTYFSEQAVNGNLSLDAYRDSIDDITALLLEIGDRILGSYIEGQSTQKPEHHPGLYGYFGELSFHLLMLRAAKTREIITLPSPISADIDSGVSAMGKNLNHDALVFDQASGQWRQVQIKSSVAPYGKYYSKDICMVRPPVLPLKRDGIIGLPLNVFYDFIDLSEHPDDADTVHSVNAHAAALTKHILTTTS